MISPWLSRLQVQGEPALGDLRICGDDSSLFTGEFSTAGPDNPTEEDGDAGHVENLAPFHLDMVLSANAFSTGSKQVSSHSQEQSVGGSAESD